MSSIKGLIDIAANLTDPMYKGIYSGSSKHQPDVDRVLLRSWQSGLEKIIITGTGLKESKEALEIAKTHDSLFCTVGCHPTQCDEFVKEGNDKYLQALSDLCEANRQKVVAVGECGLDYDRLKFCARETQLKYFEWQLELATSWKLPLFVHCRNAADDVAKILKSHQDKLYGGVIHSFDGTLDEAKRFLSMGYYIGLNGCSLKTAENLEVVKSLPSDKLLLETDAPWCEIRPSHASSKYISTVLPSTKKEKWSPDSMVKGRNEPANIVQVLEVVASMRSEDPSVLASIIQSNTYNLFFKDHKLPNILLSCCTGLQLKDELLVVGYGSGHLRLFSLSGATVSLLCEVAAHARWLTALDLATDANLLLTTAEDSFVRVWEIVCIHDRPIIKQKFFTRVEDALLVGGRFLTSDGSQFCVSAYDSNLVHCYKS